ncbi:MAG TPA: TIM barrel protein [Conexibacter sp.]
MPSIQLATGPVTWGVDFADAPGNPPWETVLDEIQRSGVGALELGPVGYLPEDPETLREALRSRGLTAVGSFIFDDMHEPARGDAIVAVARRACRAIAGAGGRVLVIIDKPGPERVATAGRSEAAPRLPQAAWAGMLATIARVADVAREHGLRPALHPHAGSCIEFEDELERIAADTDLDLCLDTGHLAYAGSDPVAPLRRYASRLAHVHLKDVDGAVLARVRVHGLDFWSALEQRIFCPLGAGVVDLPAVLAELERQRYEGFATIEQDRVPGSGAPLDDLRASLRALGA